MDDPPNVPGRHLPAWLRRWRTVTAALLLAVGTPVSVAAGWASPADRIWWLVAAGLCAGVGAWLPLTENSSPEGTATLPAPAPADPALATQHERVWNIRGPVRTFTGRAAELDAIHAQVLGDRGGDRIGGRVPAAALHGMGGIGKTQLALAYAHQHRDRYRIGWLVPSESPLTITTALAELAVCLGAARDQTPAQQLAFLNDALAARDDWLLIFDNATSPAELEPFLPTSGGGHVLITSRHAGWQGLVTPLGVDLLPLDTATELLRQRSGDPDHESAGALATELGRLPLAIEQAAAYATEHRLPLADYLRLFRERRAALLARGQPLAYQGTVAAAVTLSVKELRVTAPAAVRLLEICALLAPDAIPVQQLLTVPDRLPEPLATAARDPLTRREAISSLHQAGLLTPDAEDTFRVHRLVQDVVADQLAERTQRIWQAVGLMAALFPGRPREPECWPTCARLLPHIQALLVHARTEPPTDTLAYLLSVVGVYLNWRGLSLTAARDLHAEALAIREQLHPGDHPDVARSLNSLAIDLSRLGDFEGARQLHERALEMRQRLYRGDHPSVASSLHNLGINFRTLGLLDRALELHRRALEMRRRLFTGDHHDLAASLGNVAADLHHLGELEQARDLHEQAVAMTRRLYQGDHPTTATSLHALAADVRALGDAGRARALDEEALAMRRRLFGEEHRQTARSLVHVAADLRTMGEEVHADKLEEQAQGIFARAAEPVWEDPAVPVETPETAG